MPALWRTLRGLLRPGAVDREVDNEVGHFIDEAAAEYERQGLSPEAARRAARVDMGGAAATRDLVRSSGWDAPIRALGRDMRYGVRQLRRSPGFSIVAILLLALGIGSTTALFSVADEVLFRPLPVRAPHELVLFDWTVRPPFPGVSVPVGTSVDPKTGFTRSTGFSFLTFERLQREWRTLTGIMAFSGEFPLTDPGADGGTTGQLVSGNYYDLLGVVPHLGRLLGPADDVPSAAPVAVISHRYWTRRFGRSDAVLGQPVQLGTLTATIIGVTQPDFTGTQDVGSAPDVTVPIAIAPQLVAVGPKNFYRIKTDSYIWAIRLMGRVRDGATPEAVAAELQPVFQASALDSYRFDAPRDAHAPDLRVQSGSQGVSERRRGLAQFVLILSIIVGLMLLIVCTNLAHLLFARGEARRSELSVRAALGASRVALLRQLLTESVMLSVIGGAAGVVCAWWGKDLLLAWLTRLSPTFVFEPRLDGRVLVFAFGASLLTGLIVAIAPGLRTTKTNPQHALKQTPAGSRTPIGRVLLAGEIATSVVLVVMAGLLAKSWHNLATADLGVDRDRLLWFFLRPELPPGVRLPKDAGPMNGPMYAGILDTIRALPGVESVAQSQYPIADGDHGLPYVAIPGSPKQPDEDRSVYYESVSPGFFQTVGMPIMAGRGFTEEDQSHPVAIVNETLARRFFNGEAVGRRISITKDALVPEPQGKDLIEIVGVVRDARYTTVRDTGLPGVFVSGLLPGAGSYAVRTSIDPAAVAASIAPALADIRRFSVRNVRTQDEVTAATFVRERHFAAVSSVFGGLALLLTGIGLFGLVSYSVARRTREIGVRVALGATGRRIVGSLVRETLLLAAVGVAAGILAALAMSRVVQSLLYGLGPADPMILGGAAVVTLLIAMIAAAVPARRAASVDPLIALRSE